jgi:hypothetical protein
MLLFLNPSKSSENNENEKKAMRDESAVSATVSELFSWH